MPPPSPCDPPGGGGGKGVHVREGERLRLLPAECNRGGFCSIKQRQKGLEGGRDFVYATACLCPREKATPTSALYSLRMSRSEAASAKRSSFPWIRASPMHLRASGTSAGRRPACDPNKGQHAPPGPAPLPTPHSASYLYGRLPSPRVQRLSGRGHSWGCGCGLLTSTSAQTEGLGWKSSPSSIEITPVAVRFIFPDRCSVRIAGRRVQGVEGHEGPARPAGQEPAAEEAE